MQPSRNQGAYASAIPSNWTELVSKLNVCCRRLVERLRGSLVERRHVNRKRPWAERGTR